ncbi:MAG: TlpA disulfide reductase family protein [Capnocytophaga sp.]|nr:TlpA disulfide reductase family protein [Capnocytophaga sp.]
MKKVFLGSVALFTLFTACKDKNTTSTSNTDYAVISGVAKQGAEGGLAVVLNNELVKRIAVNQDGTFRDTLRNIGSNHFYYLYSERSSTPLFLQNGTNIEINFDGDLSQAQFSGTDAQKTQYIIERNDFINSKLDGSDTNLFGQKPQEFKENLKTIFNELKEKLNTYGFEEDFVKNQGKWADYKYMTYLNSYPEFHSYLMGRDETLPGDFFEDIAEVNFDNAEEYEQIDTYRDLVHTKILKVLPDPQNPTKEHIEALINELKKYKSSNIRTDIGKSLFGLIVPGNESNQIIYDFIAQYTDDQEVKDLAKEMYDISINLVPGAMSPTFTNYENINGSKTSLADFRGKYVYMDIWATWCGPCRMEIPHLKKLEEKFHGKDIEFVSISIDDLENAQKWRDFVKEEQLTGVQLMADNAWKSEFIKQYGIKGIPRFILIDKEGKIINYDAPRPSQPETEVLLKSLL